MKVKLSALKFNSAARDLPSIYTQVEYLRNIDNNNGPVKVSYTQDGMPYYSKYNQLPFLFYQ